nr:hypothetical protein [Tanacetum cinerariifolium]
MANQEQIPQQQDPQDQPERPASSIPYELAKQVGFNIEDIIFNPNNKVFFSTLTGGSFGYVGVNTFRNITRAHYLPHSSEYLAPPSIDIVSSTLNTNSSQPPSFTNVDTGMHKEDQQATSDPTSLEVISNDGAHPQLSSGMSASYLKQPIFLVSFIIHSESALGRDASANSTAKADPGKSDPHDSIPQQQGRDKRSKNYTLDHIFADLSKLVENIPTDFMNLESLEDDSIIVVDESKYEEDKDEGIHVDSDVETEDTLVPKPPSRSIQLKELIDQVLILQSQKRKLELEKNKVEAEVALLSAQPSFLDVTRLT